MIPLNLSKSTQQQIGYYQNILENGGIVKLQQNTGFGGWINCILISIEGCQMAATDLVAATLHDWITQDLLTQIQPNSYDIKTYHWNSREAQLIREKYKLEQMLLK